MASVHFSMIDQFFFIRKAPFFSYNIIFDCFQKHCYATLFSRHYLNGGRGVGLNPYHATYHSGHLVSRQDSLQSLSSGAQTDDTVSHSNSSV